MKVETLIAKKFVTTSEAAKRLKMKVETIQRYCLNHDEGKTPAIKALRFGRTFMIYRDSLERFKKNRKPPGRPASIS